MITERDSVTVESDVEVGADPPNNDKIDRVLAHPRPRLPYPSGAGPPLTEAALPFALFAKGGNSACIPRIPAGHPLIARSAMSGAPSVLQMFRWASTNACSLARFFRPIDEFQFLNTGKCMIVGDEDRIQRKSVSADHSIEVSHRLALAF
jgi:hypothetical protein